MVKTTTIVIYPAIGFMGATNCVRVTGKSLNQVRSMGCTSKERFDLAVEVVAHYLNGVATPQVYSKDIPAQLLMPWAKISAI